MGLATADWPANYVVHNSSMITNSGRELSAEDLDRLAGRADAGFDLSNWRPRRGRSSLDAVGGSDGTLGQHSPRVTARVPQELYDRILNKATAQGQSVSAVLRRLLEDYARAG